MPTISCSRKKFERMLELMTVDGLLPYVGFKLDGNQITSVQFDKNAVTGAKVMVVGEFDGFESSEQLVFGLDAAKTLGYFKNLKGDDALNVDISDAYITFRCGNKTIKTDRLEVAAIETYEASSPCKMEGFLPVFKKGTIATATHCAIDASVLSDMVSDTKALDQKQYHMQFEADNVFRYEAKGGSSKRGNDSISSLITDASVEGPAVTAVVSSAIPEISKLLKGAIEIHLAETQSDGVFPVWFKMKDDWMTIGYLVPTIEINDEG